MPERAEQVRVILNETQSAFCSATNAKKTLKEILHPEVHRGNKIIKLCVPP